MKTKINAERSGLSQGRVEPQGNRGSLRKDMTFFELIQADPKAAEKLAERGLFCGGCPMAQFETIEQGARAHGVDVNKLLEELNEHKL